MTNRCTKPRRHMKARGMDILLCRLARRQPWRRCSTRCCRTWETGAQSSSSRARLCLATAHPLSQVTNSYRSAGYGFSLHDVPARAALLPSRNVTALGPPPILNRSSSLEEVSVTVHPHHRRQGSPAGRQALRRPIPTRTACWRKCWHTTGRTQARLLCTV